MLHVCRYLSKLGEDSGYTGAVVKGSCDPPDLTTAS